MNVRSRRDQGPVVGRAVSTVTAQLEPTNAHERAVSLGNCSVQQAYNTTSTNGRLPTPTKARLDGPDLLAHQGEHR